jgi:5-methylcytosine-specific restriction endonuclease McrA
MNRWGVPKAVEDYVRKRDSHCIYCGVRLLESPPANGSRSCLATWEHIVNDERIVTPENIARCCAPCNSSKGTKTLAEWLGSNYCQKREISANSIADVARRALNMGA